MMMMMMMMMMVMMMMMMVMMVMMATLRERERNGVRGLSVDVVGKRERHDTCHVQKLLARPI